MKREKQIRLIKISLIISTLLIITDLVYRNINNIDYLNKDKCILYQTLPTPLFLFIEHFLELALFIFIGVFFAMLLEKNFTKYKKFYPTNPFTAFLYASLLPICSCTALPILRTLKDKINLRTLITFVVAAPLLSPPIILLSFTVLGPKYGILRIVASMILAISLGYIIEFFYNKDKDIIEPTLKQDCQKCDLIEKDVYIKTFEFFKILLPFVVIAGTLGILADVFISEKVVSNIPNVNSLLGIMSVSAIGIPIYLCNGADVLILRPFMHAVGLGTGTAITFSLTSTAICATSAVMFYKFLGKKLTIIMLVTVFILSTLLGYFINLL